MCVCVGSCTIRCARVHYALPVFIRLRLTFTSASMCLCMCMPVCVGVCVCFQNASLSVLVCASTCVFQAAQPLAVHVNKAE